MVRKIGGIILILFGCFCFYDAARAVNRGRIVPNDSEAGREIERGDPDFDYEVTDLRIYGGVSIGLGIACLFIKRKAKEAEE